MDPRILFGISLASLVIMAYEDYKERYITRLWIIIFLLSSATYAALTVPPARAALMAVGGGLLGGGMYLLNMRSRADVFVLAGIALLTNSLWVPFLVSLLTRPAGMVWMRLKNIDKVSIPTVTVAAGFTALFLVAGVVA